MSYTRPTTTPLPPTALVIPVSPTTAAGIVEREHYLHRRPMIAYAYGLIVEHNIEGICTFGVPASRHVQLSVCRSAPDLVLELNRLWVSDDCGRNSESWFVSRALKQIPPRLVVSYADTRRGHVGIIYRALSWNYAGWTDMDRAKPRLDYVPLKANAHSREATRSGVAFTVRREPKVRYWTTTGSATEQKALRRLCNWPSLSWITEPPPVSAEELAERHVDYQVPMRFPRHAPSATDEAAERTGWPQQGRML